MKRIWMAGLVGVALFGCGSGDTATTTETSGPKPAEKVKIGFVVKQMDDTWFQAETKFAQQAADEMGVELMVQEAKNGEAVLNAIETMATQGAKGLIICAPEVQLGAAIKAKTDSHGMKLMSVDDRLLGSDGAPLADVPHLGISAKNIGKLVGQAISDEMKARSWKSEEVRAIVILKEGLETAQFRVDGAKEVLAANGFLPDRIHIGSWKGATDITEASNAASVIITQHPETKKWVVFSSNDDGVMGAVRALENAGLKADSVIGVGINGTTAAQDFKKAEPTGIFASVLLSPRTHGAETVRMMRDWIKDNKAPQMETYTAGTVINRKNYVEEMKKEGVE